MEIASFTLVTWFSLGVRQPKFWPHNPSSTEIKERVEPASTPPPSGPSWSVDCTLPFLDEMGGQRPPWPLYPWEIFLDPVLQEVWWSPGPVCIGLKYLTPPEFDPRAVQAVVSRCAD